MRLAPNLLKLNNYIKYRPIKKPILVNSIISMLDVRTKGERITGITIHRDSFQEHFWLGRSLCLTSVFLAAAWCQPAELTLVGRTATSESVGNLLLGLSRTC